MRLLLKIQAEGSSQLDHLHGYCTWPKSVHNTINRTVRKSRKRFFNQSRSCSQISSSTLFRSVQFCSVLFCSIQWIQYNLKWNKKLPITKPNQYTDVFYVFCFSFLKAKFFLYSNPDSGYPILDFYSDFKLLKFEFYTPQKRNSFFIKEMMMMMMMIMIIIIMFMIKKFNFFLFIIFLFL